MTIRYTLVPSAIGPLLLTGGDHGLQTLSLDGDEVRPHPDWRRDDRRFDTERAQLTAYFARELKEFDVELDLTGTPFQLAVWAGLRAIPYGTTTSYGQLAERLGRPGAARAIGAANHNNPVAIIVPCHRVVGANGHLTGYAGGLDRKRYLLDLETGLL